MGGVQKRLVELLEADENNDWCSPAAFFIEATRIRQKGMRGIHSAFIHERRVFSVARGMQGSLPPVGPYDDQQTADGHK